MIRLFKATIIDGLVHGATLIIRCGKRKNMTDISQYRWIPFAEIQRMLLCKYIESMKRGEKNNKQ